MCLVDMARAGASSELNAALDSGAAVNSRCPMNGSTALIAAAKRGHMDIVKNLVSRNAALSFANDIGDTAVDDAFSCLLYTSPSPRDGLLSRMPSSA